MDKWLQFGCSSGRVSGKISLTISNIMYLVFIKLQIIYGTEVSSGVVSWQLF